MTKISFFFFYQVSNDQGFSFLTRYIFTLLPQPELNKNTLVIFHVGCDLTPALSIVIYLWSSRKDTSVADKREENVVLFFLCFYTM